MPSEFKGGSLTGTWSGFNSLISDYQSNNSGPVTVSTSLIDLVLAPSVTVAVNDWVLACGHVHITKGGTGGATTMKLFQDSGTAVLDWLPNSGSVYGLQLPSHAANILGVWYFTYLVKVITAGDCVLGVEASSAGSDSSVGNGGSAIQVTVFRG